MQQGASRTLKKGKPGDTVRSGKGINGPYFNNLIAQSVRLAPRDR